MMHNNLNRQVSGMILVMIALIVGMTAACGGGAESTPEAPTPLNVNPEVLTVQAPEVTPIALAGTLLPAETPGVFPTIRPTVEGELVANDPRTLVASKTEDPDAGLPFSSIRLERSLGPSQALNAAPEPLIIEILRDGSVTRNGVSGRTDQARLDQINAQIREMDFFGVSGDFLGFLPFEGTTDYLYSLTIVRGDLDRTIFSRDGLMPQELIDLLTLVIEVGNRAVLG
jgi:hypothetical protein